MNKKTSQDSKNNVRNIESGLKSAFTLVELIVVITILAILGTIAFISLQGYSRDARDSTRTADINNIKTSLELFNVKTGKYPKPDSFSTVTYSGSEIVWYQGIIGNRVTTNLKSLNEKPLDPITNGPYIYSTTNSFKEYEVLALYEGNVAYNPIINQTNAATTSLTPKIDGNYNGVFVKTTNYIIPLPSIITSETITPGSGTPLTTSITKSLVITNGTNIPKTTISQISTGALVNLKLLVYTGSITNKSTNRQKVNVIKQIQKAYSGSNLLSLKNIAYFLDKTSKNKMLDLTNNIILKGQKLIFTNPYKNCTGTGQFLTAPTYYNFCDTNDIVICSGAGVGYIISACNAGTNIAGTGSNSYGGWYNFGTTSTAQIYGNPSWNYDWVASGGIDSGSANYWGVHESNKDTATYNNVSNSDKLKMKGPCSVGYHVPTKLEWELILLAGGWTTINPLLMSIDLKMPFAGWRDWDTIWGNNLGLNGSYFTSSPNGTKTYSFLFNSNYWFIANYNGRTGGKSIRCFKN